MYVSAVRKVSNRRLAATDSERCGVFSFLVLWVWAIYVCTMTSTFGVTSYRRPLEYIYRSSTSVKGLLMEQNACQPGRSRQSGWPCPCTYGTRVCRCVTSALAQVLSEVLCDVCSMVWACKSISKSFRIYSTIRWRPSERVDY